MSYGSHQDSPRESYFPADQRLSLLALVFFSCAALVISANGTDDMLGNLTDGMFYGNNFLSRKLSLPVPWSLRKGPAHGASQAGCTGPLCKDPEVDVALTL